MTERICPDCRGTGYIISSSGEKEICPRCQGTAGIDVENDKLYQLKKKEDEEKMDIPVPFAISRALGLTPVLTTDALLEELCRLRSGT